MPYVYVHLGPGGGAGGILGLVEWKVGAVLLEIDPVYFQHLC